jgi:DNA-binding CsgD family transcriptional regulator
MGRNELSSVLSAGVAQGIDRLAAPRAHPRIVRAAGGLLLGASAMFVEMQLGDVGHGTHLLYFLLIVMLASFGLGPAAGAVALAVGAIGSLVASVAGLGPTDAWPKVLVQLLLYLVAGSGYLALLSGVIGARRHQAAQPPPIRVPPLAAESLSTRELQILRLAAAGMTVAEMSELLVLSANTVKTHLSHVYQKLNAHNRSEAIRAALHCGCLTTGDICPHHEAINALDTHNG